MLQYTFGFHWYKYKLKLDSQPRYEEGGEDGQATAHLERTQSFLALSILHHHFPPFCDESQALETFYIKCLKCKKVKLHFCLINWALCQEDTLGSGGKTPPLLTSALDGGEQSTSCPSSFTPRGKSLQHPLGRKLGGPQSWSGCYGEEKNLTSARTQTPAIQPIACHYNNWANPALMKCMYLGQMIH
jgi:hypothetical protein